VGATRSFGPRTVAAGFVGTGVGDGYWVGTAGDPTRSAGSVAGPDVGPVQPASTRAIAISAFSVLL
jgi:hypothetical protein